MIIVKLFTCLLMVSSVLTLNDVRYKYYKTEKVGNKCRYNMFSYLENDESIYEDRLCKMYTCHIMEDDALMQHSMCKLPKGFREGCTVESKTGRFPYCCLNRKMSCPPEERNDDFNVVSVKGPKFPRNKSNDKFKNLSVKNCPCLE
uniref:Venom protein 30.1 n=1 Tax=Lychas mucronatus TaxID=172552 RepID=VP30_LYCMC|nr:RecName: Full=Venom protein 30.1; Flags: Precursor [Lychas mucronatus]